MTKNQKVQVTLDSARPSRTALTRSAADAFLYRREETLLETAGKFRLNEELQIPPNIFLLSVFFQEETIF